MTQSPLLTVVESKESLTLQLKGVWRTLYLSKIKQALSKVKVPAQKPLVVDLSALDVIDTAAAFVLIKFLESGKIYEFKGGSEAVMATLQMVQNFKPPSSPSPLKKSLNLSVLYLLDSLGQKTVATGKTLLEALSFLGEVTLTFLKLFKQPQRLRFITLINLMQNVGVNALPIVGLISFLIGIVLVYQGADQLKRFGAEIFTVNLLAVSALRELGILLTAIVVAGRSGSAYTAQLGFMKLNQETDALYVLGFDPIEVLVIPRILALVLVLPLLTFFSDMMALVGGGVTTYFLLGIGPADFVRHLLLSIKPWTFWIGIIKAPVFAFFIGLIGCYEGLRVSGGAESVGRHTTQSVVESIFLVIILDAAFSIIFSLLRI